MVEKKKIILHIHNDIFQQYGESFEEKKKLLKTREKNGESIFKEIGRIKEDSIRKPPSTAS